MLVSQSLQGKVQIVCKFGTTVIFTDQSYPAALSTVRPCLSKEHTQDPIQWWGRAIRRPTSGIFNLGLSRPSGHLQVSLDPHQFCSRHVRKGIPGWPSMVLSIPCCSIFSFQPIRNLHWADAITLKSGHKAWWGIQQWKWLLVQVSDMIS